MPSFNFNSLLKNTDDWHSGLDLGKQVGLVLNDLKKAFDTVNHDVLCQNLNYYGFNPTFQTGNNFAESMGLIRKSIV